MHREILNIHKTNSRTTVVDHINRNGLDNRRFNIRICTDYTNNHRAIKNYKNKTSKYIGVKKTKFGRFNSSIKMKGRVYNLGNFKSEKEAALAYNSAAIKLYGELARINADV
jgi:hypothetical protein